MQQKQKIYAPYSKFETHNITTNGSIPAWESSFILEYRIVIRSGNNGSKGTQQIWEFWKRHPAPVRVYNYVVTRPIIKVALGIIEIIFYHKEETQTEGNRKCCNLTSWLSKILNSRAIPEQARKSEFFVKYISSTKKNPEQFKEFKEF